MPGILAGLFGVLMAGLATEETYNDSLYQVDIVIKKKKCIHLRNIVYNILDISGKNSKHRIKASRTTGQFKSTTWT